MKRAVQIKCIIIYYLNQVQREETCSTCTSEKAITAEIILVHTNVKPLVSVFVIQPVLSVCVSLSTWATWAVLYVSDMIILQPWNEIHPCMTRTPRHWLYFKYLKSINQISIGSHYCLKHFSFQDVQWFLWSEEVVSLTDKQCFYSPWFRFSRKMTQSRRSVDRDRIKESSCSKLKR